MNTNELPECIIANAFDAEFAPFDRYGKPVEGVYWQPLRYCPDTGKGSFLIRFDPGAKSLPHVHTHGEEVIILDGELIDADGSILTCR